MRNFRDYLNEQLKDPEFKQEYERLQPEFELIARMIEKRDTDGLTQKALAEKMGTKQSAISRFESGRTNPTLDFLYRLADALGAKLKVTIE